MNVKQMRKFGVLLSVGILILLIFLTSSACEQTEDAMDKTALFFNGVELTLNPNNGEAGTELKLEKNSDFTVDVPTKTGYIFEGYYAESDGNTQYVGSSGSCVRKSPKKDTTLTAHWTPRKYEIAFEMNGGFYYNLNNTPVTKIPTLLNVSYDTNLAENETLRTLSENLETIADRRGMLKKYNEQEDIYVFLGWGNADGSVIYWNEDYDFGGKAVFNEANYPGITVPNPENGECPTSITFYAIFKIKTFRVTYEFKTGKLPETVDVPYGEKVETYAPDYYYRKTDNAVYAIRYWASDPVGNAKITSEVTESVTVYAQWAPALVFITDGEKMPAIFEENYMALLPNTPTREGEVFCWEDEKGNRYYTKDRLKEALPSFPTAGKLFTGKWQKA